MHFHGFDEADSAWVDDADDWSWAPTPKGGVPDPPPVPGAYRHGQEPGLIDKIFLVRTLENGEQELFIKWKGLVRGRPHCSSARGDCPARALIVALAASRATSHTYQP